MRLSSEVMTCKFDRWEETMQHMMLVTNNGREESVISLPTEFRQWWREWRQKPQPLSSGYDGLEALFIRRVSKAPPDW